MPSFSQERHCSIPFHGCDANKPFSVESSLEPVLLPMFDNFPRKNTQTTPL